MGETADEEYKDGRSQILILTGAGQWNGL